MSHRISVVLFGATGFTGKGTIPELSRLIKLEEPNLTWGIAGRSRSKLQDVLNEASQKSGENYDNVPVITADTNDEKSLHDMTAQASLIINVTGPYRFFGEPVVKACVATGTHYIDITGEPQFMELVQLKYHKAAADKNIYILSSCGFDSIPADLGVVFLQKKFDGIHSRLVTTKIKKNILGTLNSVETYMDVNTIGGPLPGAGFNYATWESTVYGVANSHELGGIRKKLFPKRLPNLKPKLAPRGKVHKSDVINKWTLPFIGADRSVILRSQRYFYENENRRPVQVQSYFGVDSFYNMIFFILLGNVLSKFCKYDFTRKLLLDYPKFFTKGLMSHDGPPEEKQKITECSIVLNGEGWQEKSPDPNYEYEVPPNKKIIGKVTGMNPAYGATCTAAVLSAITVLTEADKMPDKGGVYPPGAAFARTSLIDKLHKHGLKFEIVSKL